MDFFGIAAHRQLADFAFASNDLDRMAHKRSDDQWLKRCRNSKNAVFAIIADNKVVVSVRSGSHSVFHDNEKCEMLEVDWSESVYLGKGNNRYYFAVPSKMTESGIDGSDSVEFINLRALAINLAASNHDLSILAQASTMVNWHKTHRFCARCGKPTELKEAGYRRDCQSCGGQHFPRTDPAVIMLVINGDRCLLGSTGRFAEGMYSTLAGFVEPGETLENAVRREIMEEAGIEVGRVAYMGNQPWPFPANLMLGCFGEALSTKISFDEDELTDCRWFAKGEVELMHRGEHPDKLIVPPNISIAAALISYWLQYS